MAAGRRFPHASASAAAIGCAVRDEPARARLGQRGCGPVLVDDVSGSINDTEFNCRSRAITPPSPTLRYWQPSTAGRPGESRSPMSSSPATFRSGPARLGGDPGRCLGPRFRRGDARRATLVPRSHRHRSGHRRGRAPVVRPRGAGRSPRHRRVRRRQHNSGRPVTDARDDAMRRASSSTAWHWPMRATSPGGRRTPIPRAGWAITIRRMSRPAPAIPSLRSTVTTSFAEAVTRKLINEIAAGMTPPQSKS